MAVFNYRAMDREGKEIAGIVEAESEDEAIRKVREMGYFPTNVSQKRSANPTATAAATAAAARAPAAPKKGALQIEIKIPFLSDRVRTRDLVVFTRQLATLIDAGLPLLRSLGVLEKQQKGGLRNIIAKVRQDVEQGASFSEALGKHPRVFTKLFVSMIKAGEMGGALETVLNRLADFAEKQQTLRRRIISAMIYPVLVTLFATGILTFLLHNVVPTFADMFADMGAELPAPTQVLIKLSNLVREKIWLPVVVVVGLVILVKLLYRTQKGAYLLDKIKLKIPVFGDLAQKIAIARFSRTLETLISSGVQILQALTITRDTVGNEVLARAIMDVHDSIREGESIARPLEASGVFPPLVTNMIEVGEETGALDVMLTKIADGYEEEVDATVAGLTSVLEPIMIMFMGGMVGFIVVSLFLPLIKYGMLIGGELGG